MIKNLKYLVANFKILFCLLYISFELVVSIAYTMQLFWIQNLKVIDTLPNQLPLAANVVKGTNLYRSNKSTELKCKTILTLNSFWNAACMYTEIGYYWSFWTFIYWNTDTLWVILHHWFLPFRNYEFCKIMSFSKDIINNYQHQMTTTNSNENTYSWTTWQAAVTSKHSRYWLGVDEEFRHATLLLHTFTMRINSLHWYKNANITSPSLDSLLSPKIKKY